MFLLIFPFIILCLATFGLKVLIYKDLEKERDGALEMDLILGLVLGFFWLMYFNYFIGYFLKFSMGEL